MSRRLRLRVVLCDQLAQRMDIVHMNIHQQAVNHQCANDDLQHQNEEENHRIPVAFKTAASYRNDIFSVAEHFCIATFCSRSISGARSLPRTPTVTSNFYPLRAMYQIIASYSPTAYACSLLSTIGIDPLVFYIRQGFAALGRTRQCGCFPCERDVIMSITYRQAIDCLSCCRKNLHLTHIFGEISRT
jgi:hypothetical protein